MPKTIQLAYGIDVKVCRALGFDPGQVERIELFFRADSFPCAIVHFYLTPEQASAVGSALDDETKGGE